MVDPADYYSIGSWLRPVPCSHGVDHTLTVVHSDPKRDNIDPPCWVGSLAARSKKAPDYSFYFGATKAKVIAEGLRRLKEGDCACPDGAFHKEMFAKRGRNKAELAGCGFDREFAPAKL